MVHQYGISGIFFGFLTGLIWLLLALSGYITEFVNLLGLGGVLGNILNILFALIGFLAVVLFGLCLFNKAWHYSK